VAQRASRESNYLSVTVTFTAQSREHLDAIYAELNNHQRVIMVI
jgi:putative lipoic acid-binding regulatory protein